MLTNDQIEEFNDNGCLVIKSFYDLESEIEPIQFGIYQIIGALIEREGLAIERASFSPQTFDSGFMELIAHNRALGGIVYDAVKQIPAFVRIISKEKNEMIFKQLFLTDQAGIGHGAQGIRIDVPCEDRFMSPWHQEYLAHMRSMKGLVYWSPLVKITHEMGPVEVCLRSHKDGIFPLLAKDPNHPDKYGAYGMVMNKEEEVIKRYPHVLPLTEPGDLILLDWLVLHRSTSNSSNSPRWAMQLRYFDFRETTGVKFGWAGGVVVDNDVTKFHPELVIK